MLPIVKEALTITWSFGYRYAKHKINDRKKWTYLLAILMAMRIRRYGAERIAQYGRSRATLEATGRRKRASIPPALPRQTPWSSILT